MGPDICYDLFVFVFAFGNWNIDFIWCYMHYAMPIRMVSKCLLSNVW